MKYLTVSKIFISASLFGLLTGIAIMYLMNGILGHAGMKEAVLAFLIFELVAVFIMMFIAKRLQPVWNKIVR